MALPKISTIRAGSRGSNKNQPLTTSSRNSKPEPSSGRRAGHIWSRHASCRDDLVPVARSAMSLRSCMKVATLEDSLRESERTTVGAKGRRGSIHDRIGKLARTIHPGHHHKHKHEGGSSTGERKNLKFDSLQVREYKVMAVDHPGVSKGPAVGLDWSYVERPAQAIDDYESSRSPRRKLKEIRLTKAERRMKLLMSGVSSQEVEEMMASIKEAKQQRMKTLYRMEHSWSGERVESAIKKLKIAMGLRKRHKEAEEDLWDEAQKPTFVSVAA